MDTLTPFILFCYLSFTQIINLMLQNAYKSIKLLKSVTIIILISCSTVSAQKTVKTNVVFFDLNAPSVNAAATHVLDSLMAGNTISKSQKLLLYGYADYLGTRAHNDSLSTSRAMNVRAYLLQKGIPESNITICIGRGAITGTPQAGHTGNARDRKVEIITDAGKIKALSCQPLSKCEPLAWSKNVKNLNVHETAEKPAMELSDNTVSVRLPNGDKYIGEISNGTKVNNGLYIWANGERYVGGDELEGTWRNDEITLGTLMIPYNGVLYHADDAHSHSNEIYKGNLVYTGAFLRHMFNGHGVAIWPNGDRYNGMWVNDKMSGHGVYNWPAGEKYEGEWLDNKMQGKGVMYSAGGAIFQTGTWENDIYKGK
jgi:outer membrane protein OmpA-like peptidoglycan-associated protein